jgi:hypothetical protein
MPKKKTTKIMDAQQEDQKDDRYSTRRNMTDSLRKTWKMTGN